MRRKILILLLLIPVVVLVAATIYQASRGGIFKKVAPAKFPESQSVDATLAQTADLQAPTVPSNLVATVVSTSQINLAWAASTDNVRVTGYRIYRCQGIGCTPTTQLIAVTGTTYQNIRLLANTTYVYSVAAYDSAANVSAQSSSVSATTPGAGDTTPPVISNGSPTGTLPAGTTQTTMSVITDENAVCRWSATTGTAYSSMTGTFSTTGATTHSTAITGLTNGTAYNRYLRCQDPAGNANTSDYIITFSIASASGADTQPPTIPSNLSATAISISQINLAWTASTDNVGVTGYRIYRCQGSGCTPSTQLTTTANTSYSDTSLTANTTYVYRVAAYDSAANVSAQSSSVSATTPGAGDTTPPVISNGSPTGTLPAGTTQTSMSVATNENAICRWSTTTGTAYSSMTGTFSTTGATTHSTAITGLSNGTAYNRYVKCQDPAGNANSADFTITFSIASGADTQAPTIPSNLTATAISVSQINLAWTASTDNVGVKGYRIYRCLGSGCTPTTQIAMVTGTTYQNTGLSTNKTYAYSVAAYDAAGKISGKSSSAQATTLGAPVTNHDPIGSFDAAASSNVSGWAYDQEAGANPINVDIYIDGTNRARISANLSRPDLVTAGVTPDANHGFNYSLTGLNLSLGNHTVNIYAINTPTGNNPLLAGSPKTINIPAPDTQAPSTPTNLSTTVISQTQINFAWTASTDNVGVTGYRIYRCQGSGCTPSTQLTTTANTSYSDTSLTANTTYVYRVAAYDSAANVSAQSSSVSATTPGAGDTTPPVISNGSPTGTLPAGTTQTSMSVATNENAICRWSTTTGTAYSSMTGTFSTTGATTHSTAITGLSNGTAYNRYVKCQDPAGNANSADFTITFSIASGADTQAPTIPSNLTATAISVSQINLSWWASVDLGSSGLKEYNVYRNNVKITAVPSTTTSYSDTGLVANTTYFYTVSAIDNANNESAMSLTVSATTLQSSVVAPTAQWVKQIGGSDQDKPMTVAAASNGDLLALGTFRFTVDFGGGPVSAVWGIDGFLARYSSSGSYIWSRRLGGTGHDTPIAIAVDANDNIFLTGTFQGTLDLGGGPLVAGSSDGDIFIAKFSSAGSHLWSKRITGSGGVSVADIASDSSGGFFLTGSIFGGNLGDGTLRDGLFLAHYSGQGTCLWAQAFQSSVGLPRSVAISISGTTEVILVASHWTSVNLGGGLLNAVTEGQNTLFMAKYSASAGTHLWSKRIGGSGSVLPRDIVAHENGDFTIVGALSGTTDFGGGPMTAYQSSNPFMVTYSSDGTYRWAKQFGYSDSGSTFAMGIAARAGSVIVTGFFQGYVDFGGGMFYGTSHTNTFVAKYSNTGVHLWSKWYGEPTQGLMDTLGQSVAVDSTGATIVVGQFNYSERSVGGQWVPSTIDFGTGPKTSNGAEDIFFIKLQP